MSLVEIIKGKVKTSVQNLRFLSGVPLSGELHRINQEIRSVDKQVASLSRESLMLLETVYRPEPWLADNLGRHHGERCYLLGCGPSLNELDVKDLKGGMVMGVNGAYQLPGLTLDYFATVSHVFWKHHEAALKSLNCRRRFLPRHLRQLDSPVATSWLNAVEWPHHARVADEKPWFFSTEAHRFVVLGGSVIFVALQILFHLGFSEVVLLGVDHDYGIEPKQDRGEFVSATNLDAHFTKDYYPAGGQVHIDMLGSERAYAMARAQFERAGRRIINATPSTKLDIFETCALAQLI